MHGSRFLIKVIIVILCFLCLTLEAAFKSKESQLAEKLLNGYNAQVKDYLKTYTDTTMQN